MLKYYKKKKFNMSYKSYSFLNEGKEIIYDIDIATQFLNLSREHSLDMRFVKYKNRVCPSCGVSHRIINNTNNRVSGISFMIFGNRLTIPYILCKTCLSKVEIKEENISGKAESFIKKQIPDLAFFDNCEIGFTEDHKKLLTFIFFLNDLKMYNLSEEKYKLFHEYVYKKYEKYWIDGEIPNIKIEYAEIDSLLKM